MFAFKASKKLIGTMRFSFLLIFCSFLLNAVAADGQVFPLQLGCTAAGARRVVEAAGPDRGAGASPRRLLASLDPAPRRVVLPELALRDVDTRADLEQIGEGPTG